jgi:hypothetical protein
MTAHGAGTLIEKTSPSAWEPASGLWNALAERVTQSAAGSGLAEPKRLGQPISLAARPERSMFAYDPELAEPLESAPVEPQADTDAA